MTWSIGIAMKLAVTSALIAVMPLEGALANGNLAYSQKSFIVAQASLGGSDSSEIPIPPAPSPPAPTPAPAPLAPSAPRFDYIPPREPAPNPQQNPPAQVWWGALAFTADGSWSTVWKMPSEAAAEVNVLKRCAAFGHGACKVVTMSGQECVGLATFIGTYRRRRWRLSFTAGGMTYPQAQGYALGRCNSDQRTHGRCQFRTATCADGR